MAGIYYAAVAGDPLDSGAGSYVVNYYRGNSTIEGMDGVLRDMAMIGDDAYCSACSSFGKVIGGSGVSDSQRIDFQEYGRLQAVGGDMVACKCSRSPRIVATYGCNWQIVDSSRDSHIAVEHAIVSSSLKSRSFDEQFTLLDSNGHVLSDVFYTVRLATGVLIHGVSDSGGRTERYQTDGAQRIDVYLGHREQ
jgi:hypothetical protein